ncbi:MAG: alpha/beta fold hydrolase [Solirubrobacteraceae bacterium]|nr:alpha/beta fold hydrolase [Solirubrobacteraceae bacterium]
MAAWLKRLGYRPVRAGMRSNVRCSEESLGRLESRLERAVQAAGRRGLIVGHSRGGMLGRALAVRRPDLVAGVVTMGTPHGAVLEDIHPMLQRQLDVLQAMGDARLGPLSSRCRIGGPGQRSAVFEGEGCCERFWSDMRAALPEEVRGASIFSETDGIVEWQACMSDGFLPIEVSSSHCGMAVHPDVYIQVAGELASAVRGDRARRRTRESDRAVRAVTPIRVPAPLVQPVLPLAAAGARG